MSFFFFFFFFSKYFFTEIAGRHNRIIKYNQNKVTPASLYKYSPKFMMSMSGQGSSLLLISCNNQPHGWVVGN